jgi:hypothetical protein
VAWLINRRCRAAAELFAGTDLPLDVDPGQASAILTDAFPLTRQFRSRFGHPRNRHRRS